MSDLGLSKESSRNHLTSVLEKSGFVVHSWAIPGISDPVILAENAYHIIAIQVFEVWQELLDDIHAIELELSALIGKSQAKAKAWDAYLALACKSRIASSEEINQMSLLTYDTRRTRKIIRADIGDSLSKLEEIVTPFLTLKQAESSAKGRDPLQLLRAKMVSAGFDHSTVERLIVSFKETEQVPDV